MFFTNGGLSYIYKSFNKSKDYVITSGHLVYIFKSILIMLKINNICVIVRMNFLI